MLPGMLKVLQRLQLANLYGAGLHIGRVAWDTNLKYKSSKNICSYAMLSIRLIMFIIDPHPYSRDKNMHVQRLSARV